MVQKEIRAVEEEGRQAKAVAMKQQGSWTQWDSVRGRSLSWKDIWNMEGHRIKFLLSSVYDVLPTPTNLQRWRLTEDPFCVQCRRPANLEHILSSCRVGLTEGRFRWRHDQVLARLADGLEKERKQTRHKMEGINILVKYLHNTNSECCVTKHLKSIAVNQSKTS